MSTDNIKAYKILESYFCTTFISQTWITGRSRFQSVLTELDKEYFSGWQNCCAHAGQTKVGRDEWSHRYPPRV